VTLQNLPIDRGGREGLLRDDGPDSDWRTRLIARLGSVLAGDAAWSARLAGGGGASLHLAVMIEPYLTLLLGGRKTVESRFSTHRRAPYEAVRAGDVVVLKRSSGPVVGICEVGAAWFHAVTPRAVPELRERYAAAMCEESSAFWRDAGARKYASFLRVGRVRELPEIACGKRDRSGWVVLRAGR